MMKSTATVVFSLLSLVALSHYSLATSSSESSSGGNRVKVDVYYETLCPDSIGFLIRKLIPNYEALSSMLQLTLIPFGKAEIYEFRDSVDFYCQHGPKECHGNMVHACALAEYRNLGQVLPFIECMEYELYGKPKPNISLIASKCAKERDLDWAKLSSCADGPKGKALLAEAGKKTKELRPKLTFVPTIVINGEYSASNQNKALYGDFVRLICNNFSNSTKPKACTASDN